MSEQEDPSFGLGWKVVSFPLTKLENARGGGGLEESTSSFWSCELEGLIGLLCRK